MKNPLNHVTRVMMAVFCLSVVIPAEATLISRLGGAAAYDDVLNITWTTDANINGSDTWDDQVAWADSFSLGGFDDWRLASMSVSALAGSLPDTTQSFLVVDCLSATELACRDNELGYMYYHNMDGTGSNTGTQTVDGVDLTNIQRFYWSGTEFDSSNAWGFDFSFGNQGVDFKGSDFTSTGRLFAWAVRSGDVAAVPEPGTMLLMSTGLFGLLGFGRSKRRI